MSKFAKNFEVEKGMYQNVPNKVRGFLSFLSVDQFTISHTKIAAFSITRSYCLPFINVFGSHYELICFYQEYHCQIW